MSLAVTKTAWENTVFAYITQWPLIFWAMKDGEKGRIECIPKHLASHFFYFSCLLPWCFAFWGSLVYAPDLAFGVFSRE